MNSKTKMRSERGTRRIERWSHMTRRSEEVQLSIVEVGRLINVVFGVPKGN